MPFDLPLSLLHPTPMPRFNRRTRSRRARGILAIAADCGALATGLIACFLVLLATTQVDDSTRPVASTAALVVIGLWIGTACFRSSDLTFGLRSTLCLLPIAAILCTQPAFARTGTALMIESVCIALLFAGGLRRCGQALGELLLQQRGG